MLANKQTECTFVNVGKSYFDVDNLPYGSTVERTFDSDVILCVTVHFPVFV